jgi:hypothetical protein
MSTLSAKKSSNPKTAAPKKTRAKSNRRGQDAG